MFGKAKKEPKRQAVGEELAQVLPDDGLPWYKKRHLIVLNYFAVSMALLTAANGFDGSMMNGLQALPQWHTFMNNPTGAWLGFINVAQTVSSVLSYPVIAWFANRYGRKPGLFIGYIFLVLGVFLQAFAPNPAAFILGRFFLGQPSSWWAGNAPLLITELAFPTHRAFLTALCQCGWYVGSLVAAWATYGTRNYEGSWAWRIPSILQIAIPCVVLPAACLIPESPRFLVSVGRVSEARKSLTRIHAGGDESSALVEFEMVEMERAIQTDSDHQASTSWMDLIRTPGNRRRAFITVTIGVYAQWNGVGVVSYYLALVLQTVGITSVTDQTLISGCLQIWNLIFAVGAAAMVDRLGRRFLWLASSIGMLASFILISGLSGSFATTHTASVGIAVVPFLFIYYAFYDIAFTPLTIAYPAEIWPYHLRSRGLALCGISTYIAVSFNIFVNPIALEAIGWKYYVVFAVILVFVVLTIYFFYPETKGHTLEEMAVVFDGEDAPVTGRQELKIVGDRVTDSQHTEKV